MAKQKFTPNTVLRIKEMESIIAIQILNATYKIDVYAMDKTEIEKLIDLLKIALTNRDIQKDKSI